MREHSGLADGVQTTANFGDMGEITSFGTDTFTTDHFGNMKTQMVGLNTTTFNWDFESHLTGIDYPGTSNDDSHEYDGNGLRMRSKLSGAADWTNFVWDEVAGNLIAEYTLVSTTFTLKSVNGWGAGLLWTNREGTKRYFHFDGDGSTWALTDASQNVTDTYEYTSFGVLVTATGSSVNPFRWQGQRGGYDDGARGSTQGLILLSDQVLSAPLGVSLAGNLGNSSGCQPDLSDDGPRIEQRIIRVGPFELRFGKPDPTVRPCTNSQRKRCIKDCAAKGQVMASCKLYTQPGLGVRFGKVHCKCKPVLTAYQQCLILCGVACSLFISDPPSCDKLCEAVCQRWLHL